MYKLFHLSHRTNFTIERLCDCLKDADLFGNDNGISYCLEFEITEVFGTTVDSKTSEDNVKYASTDDKNKLISLCSKILFEWEHRKVKLDHDYAITVWALSVMPEVRANVEERLTGDHCGSIKCVVSKLHKPLCPKEINKYRVKKWVKSYTRSGWSSRISRRRRGHPKNSQYG